MNISIKNLFKKTKKILRPEFEDQKLTSYGGLVVFEALLKKLGLKQKLASCFSHLTTNSVYKPHIIAFVLISHVLLGYKQLRDIVFYKDDEMVKRLLGLERLPDISTLSRNVQTYDEQSVNNHQYSRFGIAPNLQPALIKNPIIINKLQT